MRDRVGVLDPFVVSAFNDHAVPGERRSDGDAAFRQALLGGLVGGFECRVGGGLWLRRRKLVLIVGHGVIVARGDF